MSQVINATNFPAINQLEQSQLSADAEAAQAVVTPLNTEGYVADDFVVVGILGSEQAELKRILSVSGGDITFTSNLSYKHYRTDPITKLYADKIKIYRAANVDGTEPDVTDFSNIVTLSIESDQLESIYTDPTGGSGYWYKQTFYNSITGGETSLADAMAVRGGNYGHYVTVEEVRSEAGLQNNRWITDEKIFEKLISAESEVNGSLVIAGYSLPLAEIPENIKQATRLLAAGFLLTMDYGPEFSGTLKDGANKIKEARDMLALIEKGVKPLVDSTGAALSGGSKIGFWPDNSSDAPERMFTTQDRF